MADIYVRGGWVITLNRRREVIRNGAVAISSGVMVNVEKRDVLDEKYRHYLDTDINAERYSNARADQHSRSPSTRVA